MNNEIIGGESNIEESSSADEPIVVGGLSVSELLKRKSNELTDSKLYSFFDNLAVPIGLTCFKPVEQGRIEEMNEDNMNSGVIQNDLFDRLFNLSSISLSKGKARKTRKKIPQ